MMTFMFLIFGLVSLTQVVCLPPLRTTSSCSSAETNRATSRWSIFRHFFLPNRGWLGEQPAQVGEVLLVQRGFLRLGSSPLLLELSGVHGSAAHSASVSRAAGRGFTQKPIWLSARFVQHTNVMIIESTDAAASFIN
jgi:hypothetical protein